MLRRLSLNGTSVARAWRDALSAAKSVICYFGTRSLPLSSTDIGLRLNMGQSAVSMSSKRGRKYCHVQRLALNDLAKYLPLSD